MYILIKNNIERIVIDESTRLILLENGFKDVTEKYKVKDNNLDKNSEKQLSEMDVEELKDYAEEKGINIGKATSQSGILEKILEAEEVE